MNENPLPLIMMILLGGYFARMWWVDFGAVRGGRLDPAHALPGATQTSVRACLIAAGGTCVLLAAETLGEVALGISDEQSKMTGLFAAYTLVAAVVEELIFRGYLGNWIAKRAKAALLGWALVASLVFALLHPFLWKWEAGRLTLTLTAKGWFSFGAVFAVSLWFYACRFASWNPTCSLLPCFAAHLAKNLGVIAIKGAQGFLAGWW